MWRTRKRLGTSDWADILEPAVAMVKCVYAASRALISSSMNCESAVLTPAPAK